MFCWVWWCCVPRLGIDFVPCVQKGAIRCWPVPNPFGGSFGGKSAGRILVSIALINAQLWSHWDMRISTSPGSHKWKAQRASIQVLLSVQKLYSNQLYTTPIHCPCRREKRPGLGEFAAYRRGVPSRQIPPQNPRFPEIFYFTTKAFT